MLTDVAAGLSPQRSVLPREIERQSQNSAFKNQNNNNKKNTSTSRSRYFSESFNCKVFQKKSVESGFAPCDVKCDACSRDTKYPGNSQKKSFLFTAEPPENCWSSSLAKCLRALVNHGSLMRCGLTR